jgi:glycosyltransferase involved in cell wall biosynthesis
MVVTEALARGLPVVATDVGGVREALGGGGVLVPPEDPGALAGELRRWLTDPTHRDRLRAAARRRRGTLTGWDRTTALVADALEVLR